MYYAETVIVLSTRMAGFFLKWEMHSNSNNITNTNLKAEDSYIFSDSTPITDIQLKWSTTHVLSSTKENQRKT